MPDLNKSIQDSAGTIYSVTDVEKARAEINRLKDTVSALLGAVSERPVSQLGVKALDHIHNKLKALAQDNRFKPEERQFLTDQWKKLEAQTEGATKELDDAPPNSSVFCTRSRTTRTSSANCLRSGRPRRRWKSSVNSPTKFAMLRPSSTS